MARKDPYQEFEKKKKRKDFWYQILSFFEFVYKSAGLIFWFVILFLALLEIKRYYNIDLIPGYDSSLDDLYGAARGTFSDFFK